MSESKITRLNIGNENYPIGADAENINWNENTNLKQVLGEINAEHPVSTILNNMQSILSSVQEQVLNAITANLNLEDSLDNLTDTVEQMNINNILTQLQTLTNKVNNLKAENIQWDVLPQRNLKEVLGNLDNIPHGTLRGWLEYLTNHSSGGGSGEVAVTLRWTPIPTTSNI